MSTQMLERVDEELDLSDLDTLDDDTRHIFCGRCTPPGAGLFEAACGRWARCLGIPVFFSVPAGLCAECAELLPLPCPKCGRP